MGQATTVASHFYSAPDFPPCNEAERTSPSAALSLQSPLSKWTNHSAALRVGGACVRIWIPVRSRWLIFSGEWWLSKKNWVSRHWDRFYDAASYARRKISCCFFSFSWSLISWILHSAPWIKLQRLFSLNYLVCLLHSHFSHFCLELFALQFDVALFLLKDPVLYLLPRHHLPPPEQLGQRLQQCLSPFITSPSIMPYMNQCLYVCTCSRVAHSSVGDHLHCTLATSTQQSNSIFTIGIKPRLSRLPALVVVVVSSTAACASTLCSAGTRSGMWPIIWSCLLERLSFSSVHCGRGAYVQRGAGGWSGRCEAARLFSVCMFVGIPLSAPSFHPHLSLLS